MMSVSVPRTLKPGLCRWVQVMAVLASSSSSTTRDRYTMLATLPLAGHEHYH